MDLESFNVFGTLVEVSDMDGESFLYVYPLYFKVQFFQLWYRMHAGHRHRKIMEFQMNWGHTCKHFKKMDKAWTTKKRAERNTKISVYLNKHGNKDDRIKEQYAINHKYKGKQEGKKIK